MKELKTLKEKGLLRDIKDRESSQGKAIIIKGREYINFASNDYLGLSSHPKVIEGAKKAFERFGGGGGASRLLSGGTVLHEELESLIADFKGTEKALIFNSGYSLNTGVIPSISNESDAIFSDELNHASIIDGCKLSRAKKYIYRHKDTEHLKELIKDVKAEKKIVITDGVFSMDGDIAPIKDICRLCKDEGAMLYIDDAHATGVLGRGKGTLEHFGIKPEPWIIQMGTLSKALGSFGAFVAGSCDLIEWLINTSRSFIFSTSLPPSVIGASIEAIKIIKKDISLIDNLWANRNKLAQALNESGFNTGKTETPIIPMMMKDIESTIKLSSELMQKGIYAPSIRPPTVKTPRIRLTVTASHTDEDIEILLRALKDFTF
ncbi:MAG: 8-amino-7-oxononanoate synthase [Nitrospirae bacterium]|nr:8-amino-7-oxononanoate synthase [Nitrospirota bacterium]